MGILGFDHLFEGRIFGALRQYKNFSKRMVIERIISEHQLEGPELIVVGDGYVEIRDGRRAGAVTFGVHTRENNRYHMNSGKRERLREAGAHFLAPVSKRALRCSTFSRTAETGIRPRPRPDSAGSASSSGTRNFHQPLPPHP